MDADQSVPATTDGSTHRDEGSIGWDEGTRPRAARDREPAPRRGTGQGAHLRLIHDLFRRELAAIVQVRDDVKAGRTGVGELRSQINAMTLRQGYEQFGSFCAQYCRAVTMHHSIEDRHLFPQLRSVDGELGAVLDRLEQEHQVIHGVLVELDLASVDLASGVETFDEVDRLVDLLASRLLAHLDYEENELVGPLEQHPILI